MSRVHPLLAAALCLALAACAPRDEAGDPAATPPAADVPPPVEQEEMAGNCDAGPVQSLVGQQAEDAVVEQARTDAGAEQVRVLRPGQVVTMEYNAARLSIDVDDDGIITGVRCG